MEILSIDGHDKNVIGRQLHEIEEDRQLLLQISMDGFWAISLDGRLLEVNDTYCAMSGYSREELLTMKVSDLEARESPGEIDQHIRRIVKNRYDRFETLHRRKDKTTFDAEISIRSHPSRDGMLILFIRDITDRKAAERKLRESEQRYKALFEGSNTAVLIIDQRTGAIRDANIAACAFYGYTYRELCSLNISNINTLSRKEIKEEMKRSARETKNHFYFRHRLSTGEIRDVEVYSGPFVYEGTTLLYSVVHDITRRLETEKALRESEQLLRKSQMMANIGSYSVHLGDNTWTASPQLNRIFGITRALSHDIQGWLKRIHPDFRVLMRDIYNNLKANGGNFYNEYKIIRVDNGEERWVYSDGVVEYDKSGKPERIIGTIQDITERKLAESQLLELNNNLEHLVQERTAELFESYNALKAAELKYRTVADYTYDCESWLGTDGRFIYLSPSFEKTTGYEIAELMETPSLYFSMAHPDDLPLVESHFNEISRPNNNLCKLEYRIITKDGTEKWVGHTCRPVYNENNEWIGQRGSLRDITIRKKAEFRFLDIQKQLRALVQKSDEAEEMERKRIAREIHDELGHLLTALKFETDNLSEYPEKAIKELNGELTGIQKLIENLIGSVRKISTELRPEIIDHLGLIPSLQWQVKQFSKRTRICCVATMDSIDYNFTPKETTAIYRILQEILTNIARHSDAKHVRIMVVEKNNSFVMKVSDNGKGFEASSELNTNSLGLVGMRERAISINGVINIESQPGNGTTVMFTLPLNLNKTNQVE